MNNHGTQSLREHLADMLRREGRCVIGKDVIERHYGNTKSAHASLCQAMSKRNLRCRVNKQSDGSLAFTKRASDDPAPAKATRRAQHRPRPLPTCSPGSASDGPHATFYQQLVATLVTRRAVTLRASTLRARFAGIPKPGQRLADELGRRGLPVTHEIQADGSLRLTYSNFARTR